MYVSTLSITRKKYENMTNEERLSVVRERGFCIEPEKDADVYYTFSEDIVNVTIDQEGNLVGTEYVGHDR